MLAEAELARLAAQHRAVLKDEADVRVEVLGSGSAAVVQKTYHTRGLRWLQTWCRRSRAQREHDNLAAIAAAGVPCLQPLGWTAQRRFPGTASSTLWTGLVPAAVPLRDVLRATATGPDRRARARLAAAAGALVAALHRAGVLWCTPMPRNALVVGAPADARLVVCDTPSCVRAGRDLHGGRLARIDLFLAAFSPSRRRDWSRPERLRWLRGYTAGDRDLARVLWRTMANRRPLQNVVERALAMALLTHILRILRPRRSPTARTR